MASSTLRSVIVGLASDQDAIMKDLEKKSGVLQSALAQPASHNIYHEYKKVVALPTFSIYAAGSSLTDESVDDTILRTDLKNIGAIQSEPKEIAEDYPGGVSAFFKKQRPAFLEGFGQKASVAMIYGNSSAFGDVAGPIGMHQIVNDAVRTDGLNSNVNYINATGTTGSTTSIFAVSWDMNTCSVVFDKQRVQNSGRFLEQKVLGLNLEVTNTTTGAKKPVYQVMYSGQLSMFSASFFDIAAIRRIQDASSDKPTAANMDALLDLVHAGPGTVLYMNRTSKRLLGELKDSKLQTVPAGKEYSTTVEQWNGVPIVIDDNIVDTETTALETTGG